MLFEKIYVVNLVRRRDRRVQVEKTINDLNLPDSISIEFIDAVDGQALPDRSTYDIIQAFSDPASGRILTNGEIGCALSHQTIWEKAYNEIDEGENILILEDDIVIEPNFWESIQEIDFQSKHIDFDVLYLGRKKVNRESIDEYVSPLLVKPAYSYWTSSIVYSKKGIKKILDLNYRYNICPADEFIPALMRKGQPQIVEHFNVQEPFTILATQYNLINQTPESFNTSDTEFSKPFEGSIIDKNDFRVLSIGTDYNDGMKRLEKSLIRFGYNYELLGIGDKWNGGDEIINYPGAGQKVNILKRRLKEIIEAGENPLILFLDGYDTMVLKSSFEFVKRFESLGHKIIFGAEKSCWPDGNLADSYPHVPLPWRYLNSGQFVGRAKDLWEIIQDEIKDSDDDQLYYTHKFLSNNYDIQLDYNCNLFQCMGLSEPELSFNKSYGSLYNNLTQTEPIVAHGNGNIDAKYYFNYISNFIGSNFREAFGYLHFNETKEINVWDNRILISVFDESDDPEHIYQCLDSLRFIDYPHEKLGIAIYSFHADRKRGISRYLAQGDFANYESIMLIQNGDDRFLRTKNLKLAKDFNYNFCINSNVYLDKRDIFFELINHDRLIVGAQLNQPNFRLRNMPTEEQTLIFNREYQGLWAVSYLDSCYMIDCTQINKIENFFYENYNSLGANEAFCYNLVAKGYIPYITNINEGYGEVIP